MKLQHPVSPFIIAQPFGANANPLYNGKGLKGHTAVDLAGSYGQTITSAVDCYLYSVMNPNASPNQYRAVFTIFDDADFSYEVSYGHIIKSLKAIGNVKAGEPIATMGNFGDVYSDSHYVTEAEKLAGSTAGTHCHWQWRKCQRVKVLSSLYYLHDGTKPLIINGFYYQIVDYKNGYNGCVDPMSFFTAQTPPITTPFKDIITSLQKFLVAEGNLVMPPGVAFGYFGDLTRKALENYQNNH